MAITNGDVLLWDRLRELDLIPIQPTVLEIGRANWYGDVDPERFHELRKKWDSGVVSRPAVLNAWSVADWFYGFMILDPRRTAVDLDPGAVTGDGPRVWPKDLNEPLVNFGHYDLVINTGTCEHIFDQRRVWETIHDAAKLGGIMVHALPLWGWLDHGFVNYHPTFVADVAAENGYRIAAWLYAEIAGGVKPVWIDGPADFQRLWNSGYGRESAMMHVAFVKERVGPFKVPKQGVYSGRATTSQVRDWQTKR